MATGQGVAGAPHARVVFAKAVAKAAKEV